MEHYETLPSRLIGEGKFKPKVNNITYPLCSERVCLNLFNYFGSDTKISEIYEIGVPLTKEKK